MSLSWVPPDFIAVEGKQTKPQLLHESIQLEQLLIFQQTRPWAKTGLGSCFDVQTYKRVMWNSQECSINLTGRKRSQSLLYSCGVWILREDICLILSCSTSLLSGTHQVFIVKPRHVSLIYVGQNHKSQTLQRDLQCVLSVMLSWMHFAWPAFTQFEGNLFCCWLYLFSWNSD